MFYRSTVGWRDRFSPKPLANSLEEHVLFVCSEVDQAHCSAGAAKARAKPAAKVSGRTLLQNAWIGFLICAVLVGLCCMAFIAVRLLREETHDGVDQESDEHARE